jgi:hypothetical protein
MRIIMDSLHDRQSVITKNIINWSDRFSEIAQRTAPPQISWLMAQALETPGLISLAAGFVDQKSLPHGQIAEVMHQMLINPASGQTALQYGTTQGDHDLRTLLMDRLRDEGAFHPDAQISAGDCIKCFLLQRRNVVFSVSAHSVLLQQQCIAKCAITKKRKFDSWGKIMSIFWCICMRSSEA